MPNTFKYYIHHWKICKLCKVTNGPSLPECRCCGGHSFKMQQENVYKFQHYCPLCGMAITRMSCCDLENPERYRDETWQRIRIKQEKEEAEKAAEREARLEAQRNAPKNPLHEALGCVGCLLILAGLGYGVYRLVGYLFY